MHLQKINLVHSLALNFLIYFILLLSVFWAFPVFALSPEEAERQARLQEELKKVEADIAQQTALLGKKQRETASLERDLDVVTYQITTAKLKIKAKQIEVERLKTVIIQKEVTIGTLGERIESEKESLGELLRRRRELDGSSIVEAALDDTSLSDVFADLNTFHFLENSLHQSFSSIRQTKQSTEVQKTNLVSQKEATENAKAAIEAETRKIQVLEKQKKELIAASKNQESSYKLVLADRQKKRSQILSALFALRDTSAIPFEKALAFAKEASAGTGVRPAFILAILTQETNLGSNVGTCNRPGDPVTKSWQNIMKPSRDIEPYKRIVASLGLTPESMPLSCPQGAGYGGAMGPSQFIPSTWELYISRISAVTGNKPPNPWEAEDAFAATSLFLRDLGAAEGTFSAESRAAGKYYAGSRWATAGAGYSRSVMAIATKIQGNIDYLSNN